MKKQYFEFYNPVKICAGNKALDHIPFEMELLKAKRPIILTDKGVAGAGLLDTLVSSLKGAGSKLRIAAVFDEVPPDSSLSVVSAAAEVYRLEGCDSIIALGGGSVIDTGKGVNIAVTEGTENLSEFAGAGILKRPLKPFLIIPTTAGTGSETTLAAVIADEENKRKILLISPFLLPNAAIIDPRMTITLPSHITAATGMDALTHAVEAYTCLGKNPLSDGYAEAAMRKITNNLTDVVKKPKDEEKRLELAIASTLAGIAFSNSMVGLVHTIGHSVGSYCKVPHGTAMSILLPEVLRFNLDRCGPEYARILGEALLFLGGPERYAAVPPEERAPESITAIEALRRKLNEEADLPLKLSQTGKVREEDLPEIAGISMGDASGTYNPAEYSREDVLEILRRTLD